MAPDTDGYDLFTSYFHASDDLTATRDLAERPLIAEAKFTLTTVQLIQGARIAAGIRAGVFSRGGG